MISPIDDVLLARSELEPICALAMPPRDYLFKLIHMVNDLGVEPSDIPKESGVTVRRSRQCCSSSNVLVGTIGFEPIQP